MRIELALIFIVAAQLRAGGDWPQFLGPNRDGSSPEKIAADWKKTEPKVIWKKGVGAGFAGPIVSGNLVVLFHRRGPSEILQAFDTASGASKWQNEVPTSYRDDFGFDDGPRAVPTVADGMIYAMGAEGTVRCVNATDGKTVWTVATKDIFKARKGFFGLVCSPLVDPKRVIVNIGGENGAGIVALDRKTGKLLWKSRQDEASYSSPVFAELDGKSRVVAFTREGVCVLDPEAGKQLAEFPWRSRMHASVNAATPLVSGNLIFITASYGTGAALLEWDTGALKKVWSNDDSLSSHYATPVVHDGFVYGFHGRQEYGPSFTCIELKTGKTMWNQEGFGAGTVLRASENLLILRESGELTLAKASPTKFEIKGNTQILGSGTRAYPALSDNRVFARDKNSLACVKLPNAEN
jgi:outer membrane protein assembly factor BamB